MAVPVDAEEYWRAEVDHWWAEVLQVPVDAVRAGGAFALGHVNHAGVVAVDNAANPIVHGPAEVLPTLQAGGRASRGDDPAESHYLSPPLAPQARPVLGPAR